MALMRISRYQRECFEGAPPDRRTIIAMIDRGELYGEKRGIWYVDPDRPPANRPIATDLNQDPRKMTREQLHPLARRVLEKS